jgi:cardiolipin synthase
VQSVTTDPYTRTSSIRTAHDQLIKNAQKEIVAIYPYFSDDKLVKELIAAKKKNPNLSVKVMMPSNKEASHEGDVYQTLNRETAIQLVKAGVEVRYFDGGVVNGRSVQRFSHMKAMMIDGQILSIGGANGDARSYKNNHELNTLIESKDAVQQFQSQVVGPDWASAHPVTLKELENVPLWEKVKQKFLEAVDFML